MIRLLFPSRSIYLFIGAILVVSGALQAQTPANQPFNFGGLNDLTSRIVDVGTMNYTNANVGAPTTGSNYSMLGNGSLNGGIFRNDVAYIFNYANGSGAYLPYAGQSITGDYRISFSPVNDTVSKSGNFQINSMYLAIGTGKTANITIQGFRAGKMMAQATIVGLHENDGAFSNSSTTDLNYSGSDAYSGINIGFGSNWIFLDAIRFVVPSAGGGGDIPLAIDDLDFSVAVGTAPSTPSNTISFNTTTGISSNISWTPGSGDSVIVLMAALTDVGTNSPAPADGSLYRTINTSFGTAGTAISGTGSTTWYAVYKNKDGIASPSVTISGLTPGTSYRAMVISYNGSLGSETYAKTPTSGGTANINNFTTTAAPTTQASNISVTPDYTDFKKAVISWTRGNGAKCAVFVRNNTVTTSSTVTPQNNNNNNPPSTFYTYTAVTDSSAAISTTRVGSTGWYCVYNGTGTSVSMTRITNAPDQALRVMVVEYNGAAGSETYNTTSASGNVVTYNNPGRPVSITNAATGITSTSATLNGSIDPKDGNILAGTYTYSLNSSLSPVLGTVTSLTPAATTILGSLSTTTVAGTVTGLSPSTTYYYRLSAQSNVGTFAAANNSSGATNGINSFITAPVISVVSSTLANGAYTVGQSITITISFTSAVTVTGTPTLALNTGATASYTGGSGSATLSFNYTVGAGENIADLDYTGVSALSGGTITNSVGTDALLTLPSPGAANSLGASKNIKIDTQTPSLTSVTILSNNPNTALAKAGDIVTLAFVSNETINAPTVTISGGSATISNTGGNNWTATRTMSSSDANGAVSFSIAFSDPAGNAGTTVTTTTNSSSVSFDKTAPGLSGVGIASSYTNSSLARAGDLITISFTANEGILTPTASISGSAATVTNTGGNNWLATRTVLSSDPEGITAFSISFADLSGNTGTTVTATTNSSSVVFDKTLPVLSNVSIASGYANPSIARTGDPITVSFTASETIATPSVTISGSAVTAMNTSGNNWIATRTVLSSDPEGVTTFSISFADLAAHAGTTVTGTTNGSSVVYDKTSPVLSSVGILSSNTNSARAKSGDIITVSFTANEGIFTPTVTINNTAATVTNAGGNNWTASRTLGSFDPETTVVFSIIFEDLALNAGTIVTATTNSSTVVFDQSKPLLTSIVIASNNTNTTYAKTGNTVTVNFSANETLLTPTVTIGGAAAVLANTSGNSWTATRTMTGTDVEGMIAFNITFNDLSGNAGTAVTATHDNSKVVFDKTPPMLSTASISSGNSSNTWAKTGDLVSILFTSTESISTPTVTIAGRTAVVTDLGANNWRARITMAGTDAEGTITFNIAFSDLAGNSGTTVTTTTNSSSVVFDKTIPALTAVSIVSNNANNAVAKAGDIVTLSFTASETLGARSVSINGISVTAANAGGNNWMAAVTVGSTDMPGNVPFIVSFSDLAGNAGTTVTSTTNNSSVLLDNVVPVVSGITRNGSSPSNAAQVEFDIFFSETVFGVDISDFLLTTSGVSGASIILVTPSPGNPNIFRVTVNTGSGDGTIRLDLKNTGTGIGDAAGNIAGGYTAGQVFTINKIGPPQIQSQPGNSAICAGANTSFTIAAQSADVITYQWQVNTGTGFNNLANAGVYSNVTTAVLNITAAPATYNGYQYRCIAGNSYGSTASNAVTLTVNALPAVAAITGAAGVCSGKTVILSNATAGGVWVSSNTAAATITNAGVVTGVAAGSSTISYRVTDANNCVTTATAVLAVDATPTIGVQPAVGAITKGNTIRLFATVSPGATIAWTPASTLDDPASLTPNARPLTNTNYTATVTSGQGCGASASAIINVMDDPAAAIYVNNVFTPNGDGINDKFVINNIDAYPVNTLQVFDQNSKLIFQATNYHNEWDGNNTSRALTSGTYYYVFKVKGQVVKQGALNIVVKK
jgi:gliding motility-associated-like protein